MKRINGNIFKRAVSLLFLLNLVVVLAFVPVNDTSAAEATAGLKVKATSNFFPEASATVDEGEEYVTVTYFINSPKDMLNVQWTLTYDPAYLEFVESVNIDAENRSNLMPMVDDLVWNADSNNNIKANASDIELYKFADKGLIPFVSVTFKVIGSGETVVDLNVEILTFSLPDSETQKTDSNQEELVINNGVVDETKTQTGRKTSVHAGLYDHDYIGEVSNEEDIYSALNNGANKIKLSDDITLSGTLDLSDKIITLDLNGHVLTGNIKLADNSETPKSALFLIDSSVASGGVLNGEIDLTCSYLYANGGTVMGQVSMNDPASAIFSTSDTPTVFKGYVGDYGEIHGGIFYGDMKKSCIKEKYVTFMNGDDTYAYEVVDSGSNTVAPVAPDQAKYGYQNFDGWYNGEAAYSFGSALSEDIILTAKFSNPTTFIITYDLDGGTATNPTSYNVESDTITLNNPKKTGYTFTGWSGTDLTGADNMTVTIPKGSMGSRSYTAHFSPNSYTVVFDTVGGSDIMDKTGLKWTDKVLDGVTAPTKDGWEFTGWKYADMPVTANTEYADLATTDTTTSITLVAQWKDINAPTGEISIGTKKWTEFRDDITFSLFFKDTQNVTITAGDKSGEAVTIKYLLSNKVLTDSELDEGTFIEYTKAFNINQNSKYVIYARLTDASGNVTYINSEGIVLDSEAPVISGVENGKTYCEAQSVTVTEEYIKSVTVNGTEVTLNENNQFTLNPAEGKQTIVVTDEAENVSAEMIVTVNDGHTADNDDGDCSTPVYCIYHQNTVVVEAKSHDFSGQWLKDKNGHWHICQNDGCTVAETKIPHSGTDDGDCATAVICECGYTITAANAKHSYSDWQSNGDGTHTRYCTIDGCNSYEDGNCTGGKASYFNKAVCDICHKGYGKLLTDTVEPAGEISIGTNKWNSFLNTITFGLFFKDTQSVTITATDDSYNHAGYTDDKAVKVEYYLYSGDTALTKADLAGKEFMDYNGSFNINADNKYVVYARLTDHAGNITYISSKGVVLDSIAPVISGVENGKTYCEAQTVTVTEEYIKSVTVNGTEVTLNENNQFTLNPAEGKQTIVVTDEAENVSAEMIVTVNNGHTDDNKDHVCDYGCAVEIGEHRDDNKDHACDYGCSVAIGEHIGGEATCTELAICDICGEPYGELDSSNHNLEKISAKDATATENGNIEYWHCLDCSKYFSDKEGKNSIVFTDIVLAKLPPEIIEGTGQSVTQGDKKVLVFRSNAAFGDFIRVDIDGNTLDENNYTTKEGSIIVTLNADYTATLSAGEHTIGIVSESGTAATTFTVNVKKTADNHTKFPGTGDTRHIVVWFALILVGGCLLIVTVLNGISIEARRKH